MDTEDISLRDYFESNGIKTHSSSSFQGLKNELEDLASRVRQKRIMTLRASGDYESARKFAMEDLKDSMNQLKERENEDEFLIESQESELTLRHIRQYYVAQNYTQTEDKKEIPNVEDNGKKVQNNGPLVFRSGTLEARVYPKIVRDGILISTTTSQVE